MRDRGGEGEGGGGRGGVGRPLLTKSRLVSISRPHHPSPLDGAGREEGKGDKLDVGSVPGPSLQGPFPGAKTPGGVRVSVPLSLGAWVGVGQVPSVPEPPDQRQTAASSSSLSLPSI